MTGASDDGQADVAVTEADRETAKRVLWIGTVGGTEERVAAALAAEREKARAPFLALADELATAPTIASTSAQSWHNDGLRIAASRIRRAAEDVQ